MHYAERREQIYRPLREAGLFTWDYMYGEEYALASVITEPLTHYDELRVAAERLGLIYKRVRDVLLQAGDELLLELGVPEAALGAVRVSIQPDIPTMIGRFDFAVTPDGIRMLEFNSDTPTGIVEAFEVNDHVCQYYGLRNPNAGCKGHIREAFQQTLDAYRSTGYPVDHLVFSALDWHEEDAATTRYLHQQSGREDARFVPLSELRVFEDRLYVMDDDRPIDVLYRLHAIEKLAEDRDEDGYPTGEHVLALIANRKLAIINPPEAFLSQSKSVQALIWSLYEDGAYFTDEERQWIGQYMLPIYWDNRFEGRAPYVRKPILGREGGGVTLFQPDGEELERDEEAFYWEQPMVYQQMAPLPQHTVETMAGLYTGHVLWGTFLIGGQASAVVARIGGRITGNLSCYLPTAVEEFI